MFGQQSHPRREDAPPRDERLHALLRRWQGVEPRAGFEAAVWRRIRSAPGEEPQARPFAAIRAWFAPQPAWVNAVAATAGIAAGVLVALSAPGTRDSRQIAAPLLHSQTLAGAYLTMVTGGTR
jgi:hypothetical protein